MNIMEGHIISFAAGFTIDLILGDPHNMPHPIRLIGNAISYGEKKLLDKINDIKDEEKRKKQQIKNGRILVVCLLLAIAVVTSSLLVLSYLINIYAGIVVNAIEAWAADEFRSTNGQLQWIITEALRKAKRLPKKKRPNTNDENNNE
ncbi:MAG: cobalamin biosynthesis protein [Lachnospiraceae bacterium]|nr:cobalamin biosynthesis protein [Lachnospiraceae bacterium]